MKDKTNTGKKNLRPICHHLKDTERLSVLIPKQSEFKIYRVFSDCNNEHEKLEKYQKEDGLV